MRALVTASARFLLDPAGALWTINTGLSYGFWARYLAAYERVTLLVRAEIVATPPTSATRVTGPGIEAAPLIAGNTPVALWRGVRAILSGQLVQPMAVHLRVPCPVGSIVRRQLPSGQPYAVEVVGDPSGVFAPGAFRSPFRAAYRRIFTRELRRDVAGAVGAAYVTSSTLQLRYPPAPDAVVTNFSSIDLGEAAFRRSARLWKDQPGRRIVFVGSLARPYKGVNVLLKAVSLLISEQMDVQLSIVGDGRLRRDFEEQAQGLGIADHVSFVGQVPSGADVAEQLDEADLFVLPSLTEGLPRAMIEAMARGLPCVGTRVGGVPELLPGDCLVPPGDAYALARTIASVLKSSERLEEMSARNLKRSKAFSGATLQERRSEYYRAVAERVEAMASAANRHGSP